MTPRTVRKLSDLEIDEISLVDRPANQHGLVAIAKRDEGFPMALWDEQGNEVFPHELQHGMTVFDDDDNPLVYVEGDEAEDLDGIPVDELDDPAYDDGQGDYVDEEELDGALAKALGLTQTFGKAGGRFGAAISNVRTGVEEYRAAGLGNRARQAARNAPARAMRSGGRLARQSDVRRGAGMAGVAAGGGGYASGRRRRGGVGKSLGDGVYESLSKALSAEDARSALREVADEIGDMLQTSQTAAARSYSIAKALAEEREDETWMQVADGYDLPVDPRALGGVLKRAGRVLPARDVAMLDRIFKAAGEANYFAEQGVNGGFPNSTHDMVEAAALEVVGKTADGTTKEQAIAALYAANPAAYDEYLAEQAGLR